MRRAWWTLAALAAAAMLAAGIWALRAWRLLHHPHEPATEVTLEVAPGDSARSILRRLEEHGVLLDATLARLYLVYAMDDPPLHAGEYHFAGPASTPEILAVLAAGEVVLHAVTVIEGLTLEETARQLADAGFGDQDRFLEAMRSPEEIADLDPAAETLEGYLFPETYNFPSSASEKRIVAAMVDTFRAVYRRELAGTLGATALREIVILASIVEKEAQLDRERPIIAGVYRNRLDRGIGLYADPTIIYALKRQGRWDGDIRRRDLELDSPYNTYRYPGLPPGPICSPGRASLRAAAEPAEVPYLYFVSRNDGSHAFAETLRQHNRNVDEWQRRYWRERRERGSD